MRLWQLEEALQDVEDFRRPKVQHEQYATTPHLAAAVVYTAATSFGDISEQLVLDLGCGCGMLTAGASMMGAAFVVGLDIDPDALSVFQENTEGLAAEALLGDARKASQFFRSPIFDTVLTNPPFGTKNNAGIDVEFVEQGLALGRVVYSFHKTSTREYLSRKRFPGCAQVLAAMKFDLPARYKFHKKESVVIEVDLVRFIRQ